MRPSNSLLCALSILICMFALATAAPHGSHAAVCQTDALSLLLQNDGDVGMYLKRVDGPVMAGFNESQVFEPASAIKVLIHAHAMRQVQDGFVELTDMIDWTRDLDEDECGSHPCNVGDPKAESDELTFLLREMMECSDNRHTQALRDFFGDDAILETAAELGMFNTDFNHIIGCPDCDNLNELTLVDLGRLYERVATGFLDEEHQELFHDHMLNEGTSGFINTLNSLVDSEAANQGKSTQVADDFKALIRFHSKGGSYTLFNCNADAADSLWRSVGGWVQLPINNGNGTCEYVYGAWMNLIPMVAQSTGAVAGELLRLAVCEALQTWDMIDVNLISETYDPPNPWPQDGLIVNTFKFAAGTDLYDVQFFADPLQDDNAPCETNHPKRIHNSLIEFIPPIIPYYTADDTVEVEVKITVPMGQHAGFYDGFLHMRASIDEFCVPTVSEKIEVTLAISPLIDLDVDDNHGNVSDNVLHLKGAKNTMVSGTFTLVNPNTWDQNVDFADGPGNLRIEPQYLIMTDLVKIGDPLVEIPKENIDLELGDLPSLGSGEAADVTLTIDVPDGIPVNAFYKGRIEIQYEACASTGADLDGFEVLLEVLPTQGALNIVQTSISEDFCPPNPWLMEGHVALSFDVQAIGDHRNIRVASGGLVHETMDKKLDLFNFFPEEIAFLAAGETRTINVITKIPIGQHSGSYADYFRVVSENAGEDSVHATINICEVFDLDIKDDYANLTSNVMEIQAIGHSTASGGEWKLRAFDLGLPAFQINNDDDVDGPGNTPVDCVTCEFAEWSPLWHEDDHDHHFHQDFMFEGFGTLMGDTCGWESGQYKRLMVGIFVPKMMKHNSPGTYKGRLDCYAIAGPDTVDSDFFDIEIQLARIIGGSGGPGGGPPNSSEGTFGGYPTLDGSSLYWGDFTSLGMRGGVNLYRQDHQGGDYHPVTAQRLPQGSHYLDRDIQPGNTYSYKLGILGDDGEMILGPITVGANPRNFLLAQNAPNPFKGKTAISYQLPVDSKVLLRVFDLSGRLVRTLTDETQPAGFYSTSWDQTDSSGRRLSSGIYFYRLDTPEFTKTKKMVILK